jgi:hypothetical protein
MRDWVLIGVIALLSAVVGYFALRRRPPVEAAPIGAAETPPSPKAVMEAGVERPDGPAPAAGAPLAVLIFDGAPGRVAVLQPEVVIGRHSEDDIRVPDVRVSRHHARLVAKRGGGFEIHNLTAVRSEPNPMLVNGEAREHADINDGDVVSLGGVNFTFRAAA